jgi:rubrerythrin
MAETTVVQRALAECWAGEVSGVTYYESLGERFPEHRHEADVLVRVEKTTRDLIEAVARNYEVSIDHDAAERLGIEVAQSGSDWREALANALAYTPDTLRMFENLADVLPENESALGQAVVEHERAQIVLFESVVAGKPCDWSAIDAFLERRGAGRIS